MTWEDGEIGAQGQTNSMLWVDGIQPGGLKCKTSTHVALHIKMSEVPRQTRSLCADMEEMRSRLNVGLGEAEVLPSLH